MSDRESADKNFEEIRAQLLRSRYVGRKGEASEGPAVVTHLYEQDIAEAFPENDYVPRPHKDDALSEMLKDIQGDLDKARRDTDAAVRRFRIQAFKRQSNLFSNSA